MNLSLVSSDREQLSAAALEHPSILALIASNARFSSEIKSSAVQLSRRPDINNNNMVPALLKASDAIINGVKIFISYKTEEEDAANKFRKVIRDRLSGRICKTSPFPFLAGYGGLSAGETWRERIHAALNEAHWFFLLKPDDEIDRDWLVFEAGYFRRGMLPGDRLICLYSPHTRLPDQISNLQGVPAAQEDIARLISELISRHAVPGMDAIDSDPDLKDIEQSALQIQDVLRRKPIRQELRRHYVSYVDIDVGSMNGPLDIINLRAMKLLAAQNQEQIFGVANIPTTFGELIDKLRPQYKQDTTDLSFDMTTQWLDLLLAQIAAAVDGAINNGSPIQPTVTFRGIRDHCIYRPVVHAARIYQGEATPHSVHLAFVRDLVAPVRRAPRYLANLEAALRLTYRFRWEVLDEYGGAISVGDLEDIRAAIYAMEAESAQRGLFDPDSVATCFNEPEAAEVRTMYEDYKRFRNKEGSGLIDVGLLYANVRKIELAFEMLRPLNARFARIASARFSELVHERW